MMVARQYNNLVTRYLQSIIIMLLYLMFDYLTTISDFRYTISYTI